MTRSRASARAAGSRFERVVADWLAAHVDDRIDRRVKTGAKEGAIHGQQKDVNLLTETAKNYPGAVGERAKELGNAADDTLKCVKDPITCWWEKTSKTQKLAVGIGAGVLTLGAVVYTTTIFSGAITAVGNVAEKLTKNAPKRRRKAR